MSSVRIGQDLPPEGGFAPITYKKRLPKLGPPGWAIFLGVGLFMGAGIYKKTMDNRQFRSVFFILLILNFYYFYDSFYYSCFLFVEKMMKKN